MIWNWIGLGLLTLKLLGGIVGRAVESYYWQRCKDQNYKAFLNPCRSETCKYRRCCSKWEKILKITDEEAQELYQLIDELLEKES